MILEVFSIRDSKAECYNTPFFKKTKGEALRDFTTAVNDEKSQLNQYPTDFDVYHVGNWDSDSGKFIPLDTPKHLAKAVDMVIKD